MSEEFQETSAHEISETQIEAMDESPGFDDENREPPADLTQRGRRRSLFRKPRIALIFIVLVGTVFRLIGLFHGIDFHPDERSNIMHVMKLSFQDMNPHFFAYGSIPFYLLFFVKLMLAHVITTVTSYVGLFKLGRVISALAGILTILVTYFLGKKLYNERVGLLASFFLAIAVLHIQYSHFYAVDILLTLVVAIVFLGMLDIVARGSAWDYAKTGLIFGIGMATKISILPLSLPILVAHLFRLNRDRNMFSIRSQSRLFIFLLSAIVLFTVCQPYTFLDFKQFSHDIREQGNMARGVWQPPYAIQYEKTLAYLYPLEQLMKWSLGYPLVAAALAGLFLMGLHVARRRSSSDFLVIAWVILYFGITGSFAVKFLRYMLPLFPFLCIAAALFFDWILQRREGFFSHRLGRFALVLTILYQLLFATAFSAIYFRPHPYFSASEWMYDAIPSDSMVLTEHWDDGMPVRIAGKNNRPRTRSLPLYERDSEKKTDELVDALIEGDYIVQATKRLYGSICRVPERYPVTSRYYRLLLSERLGYRLIKSYQSYPSLFGYEIVDDLADESFSVYDHPKVLVYQKIRDMSRNELREILTTPLTPDEDISYEELLHARTFDDLSYVPFDPDRSGTSLLMFTCYFFLGTVLFLPLGWRICRDSPGAAWTVSKLLVLVGPPYIAWVLSHFSLPVSSASMILSFFILAGISFLIAGGMPNYRLILSRSWPSLISRERFFTVVFLLFVLIRMWNPEIYWGEKPMDFSFLNACYRVTSFPPPDPWFSGKAMNYYYFGYFEAAYIGRLLGISPGIIFNLFISLIPALGFLLCFELLRTLKLTRYMAVVGAGIVLLGSNLSAIFQVMSGKKPGFSLWWDTSRILPSPAIDEYPIWSFLFADLHGHVMAIPVGIGLIFMLILFLKACRERRWGDSLVLGTVMSFLSGVLGMTNAWDLVPYTAMLGVVLLLTGLHDGYASACESSGSSRLVSVLKEVGIRFSAGIVITGLGFGWTIWYYRNFFSADTSMGIVRSGFAHAGHLFLHFGHFLLILLCVFILWLIAQVTDLFTRRSLFGRKIQKSGSLWFVNGLWILIPCVLGGLLYIVPRSALVAGIILMISGILMALYPRNSPRISFVASLLAICGAIIAGSEIFTVIDRMNTIFKFYYPAWIFLGIASIVLLSSIPKLLRRSRVWSTEDTETEDTETEDTETEDTETEDGQTEDADEEHSQPPLRQNIFGVKTRVLLGLLAVIIFAGSMYGSLVGISTVTSLHRVPSKYPTLDGRFYQLLSNPSDYCMTRWMNRNLSGFPVIAEAHGPSYQNFSRISMHTGLPTLVGWDHHVYQRGASRAAIRDRQEALRTLYTSSDGNVLRELCSRYAIEYIVVGDLERKQYGDSGRIPITEFGDICSIIFSFGQNMLLKVRRPDDTRIGSPIAVPALVSTSGREEGSRRKEIRDWDVTRLFPLMFDQDSLLHMYDFEVVPGDRLLILDPLKERFYEYSLSGSLQLTMKSLPNGFSFKFPAFCSADRNGSIWFSDGGNNRIVQVIRGRAGYQPGVSFDGDLKNPAGISQIKNGMVFVADYGNNRIMKFDPATRKGRFFAKVQQPLTVQAFEDGRVAVFSAADRNVTVLDASGRELKSISLPPAAGFQIVPCFLTSLDGTDLIVGDALDGSISMYDQSGELIRVLESGFRSLRGLAADDSGCLYAIDAATESFYSLCPQRTHSCFDGGEGSEPGQFREPRGVSCDAEGNIYVADTRNHRIQKFNSDGSYLLQWGREGDAHGEFREPMGISITESGYVVVADTWNQRIQVFDQQGTFIRQWSDQFYGPRDLVAAAEKIFVSDTGNHMVKVYNEQGVRVASFGSRGSGPQELNEPLGITWFDDRIFVCDLINRRIQVINQTDRSWKAIPVNAWEPGKQREPYIAVLPDSRIAITDTGTSRVIVISETGEVEQEFSEANDRPFHNPRGLFSRTPEQDLLVVDTWNHRIQRLTDDKLGHPDTSAP